MASQKANGSVDLLAKAMRQVFQEATEKAVEPVTDLVGEIKEELVGVNKRLDSQGPTRTTSKSP